MTREALAVSGSTEPVWHLYIVRARDGSLYTGIATDVERRMAEHGDGKGAKYLRGRGPVRLEYRRRIGERALALKVEHGVKRLSKTEKERLVQTNPGTRRLLKMTATQ